jgi:hypothetical protein
VAQKTQKIRVTKPMPVRLTDAEVLKYGRDAARAVADRTRIEAEFDSVKADYKSKIGEQTAIIGKLSPRIHSGIETRDVECEEVRNWTKGTVTVTRLDTGEVVESRPMREDEKQMEVTFEEDGGLTPEEMASPAGKVLQFVEKVEAKRRVVVEDATGTMTVAEDGTLEFDPAEEPAADVEGEAGNDEPEAEADDTSSNPFA